MFFHFYSHIAFFLSMCHFCLGEYVQYVREKHYLCALEGIDGLAMKILAVGMNYARHIEELGNRERTAEPVLFLKPDSSVLKTGMPFFLPDFGSEIHYETEVVVRICRLGKNILPKFARRYYDAATVGIDFTARDMQQRLREKGLPWMLSKGFDNATALGRFVPLEQLGGDVQNLHFRLDIDGRCAQQGHTADMLFGVDEIIAYVSRFMTLKIGDLLFTGTPAGVGPVAVGQHLQGYVENENVLDFYIK